MDNYANKALTLSNFRGMNQQDFAHSSDEAARLINFKPTGAGLEMRNGARTLMEGAINGKIVGEGSRAMMTSDGYVIQKVTDDDGVVTLVNTGYQPFRALDNCFGTEYKDVFVVTPKGDDKSYVATLDENMVVLFDNAPIDENGADQSMALWTYNWNLKSILGCGMGIGSTTIEEIDRYLLDSPVNIKTFNFLRLGGATSFSCPDALAIYSDSEIMLSGGSYYSEKMDYKKRNYIYDSGYSPTNSKNLDSIQESYGTHYTWYDTSSKYIRARQSGASSIWDIFTTGSEIKKPLIMYNNPWVNPNYIIFSFCGTKIYSSTFSETSTTTYLDCSSSILDYYVLESPTKIENNEYKIFYVVLLLPGGLVKYAEYNSETATFGTLNSLPSVDSDYTKISGCSNQYLFFQQTTENGSYKSFGYFVVYNDTNIQRVNFEFIDGEFVNVKLAEKLNSTTFPFVTGGIKSISIQTNPYMIPLNYHNSVGVRPYFGDSEVSGGTFNPTFVNSELVKTEYEGTVTSWTSTSKNITGVSESEIRNGDFLTFYDSSAGIYETRQVTQIYTLFGVVYCTISSPIGFSYASGDKMYIYPSSDMYVQPVLGSEYAVPINVGDGVKFNANVPDDKSAKVWQYWLFYIIPSPTLDNSVESLRLLRGSWGDKGFYEVSAYGDESDGDGGYIATEFANYWGTNSVLAFEVGGGSSDMNVFNCTDGFEDDFKGFLGRNSAGMSCKISTITSGSETSNTDDDYNVMKAYFKQATNPDAADIDVGITNSFSFELTEGEQYWLSFTAATDIALGARCDFYIYTSQNNKVYKSLEKTQQELSLVSDKFTNYGILFKCIKSGYHTFRIDTDYGYAHTLYVGNISLSLYSAFPNQVDLAWKSFEDDKFIVQDYKHGGTWDAYLDKSAQALYFTEKSMCYADKGQSIAFSSDVIVCGFNSTGLFLATQNEVYVVTGTTFDSIANTKVLDYGLPDENYYGFDISAFGAVVFNEEGLFYLNSDTYADNAGANLSDKILEYLPLANSDSDHRTVCFDPINQTIVAQGKDNLNGSALTIGDVVLGMWLAIYDLVEKSWHLYAYNAEEPAKSYCQFLKAVNRVVVNMGDTTTPATSASVRVMEESNDTAREDYGFLNEAWDFMIGNFLTRSMSFDYPMNVKRLTRTQYLINTLRPFDDVAQYDWVRGAFYEQYAPHSADSDQRIVAEFETDTFDVDYPNTEDDLMMSFLEQMNCKFLVGAMDLWIGRLQDTENPKALLVSAIYRIEYSYREKRGGF